MELKWPCRKKKIEMWTDGEMLKFLIQIRNDTVFNQILETWRENVEIFLNMMKMKKLKTQRFALSWQKSLDWIRRKSILKEFDETWNTFSMNSSYLMEKSLNLCEHCQLMKKILYFISWNLSDGKKSTPKQTFSCVGMKWITRNEDFIFYIEKYC